MKNVRPEPLDESTGDLLESSRRLVISVDGTVDSLPFKVRLLLWKTSPRLETFPVSHSPS